MATLNSRRGNSMPEGSQVELTEGSAGSGPGRRLSNRSTGLPGLLSRLTTRTWEKDEDIGRRPSDNGAPWLTFLALTFQSIGIVYGDIGTSPLYVFASVFLETPTSEDVIGVTSLVMWTITALVLCKYALVVLRADDNGQGGAFALFSLLRRQAELGAGSQSLDRSLTQYSVGAKSKTSIGRRLSAGKSGKRREHRRQVFIESPFTQTVLRILVVIGVGAIMGDGVLTPAVSVVSACEGINVKWPSVTRGVIDGIAIAIIVVLFGIQQFGTGFVGSLFSPIVTLWLISNAVIGVYNIAVWHPGIFIALSPHKWFGYFLRNGTTGWRALGGVLLCVTGCEALFADLGHFTRRSIQTSFIFLCWPSLLLTYLGQGAFLVKNPDSYSLAFWDSLPSGTFYYMWILATLAAIIASQALISAAFQIVKQAIAGGFFPRFTVIHTSKKHQGQVYIPAVCYLLGGLCVILIATFKTSLQLTKAYGLAVVIDMLLTTHFATLVIFCVWQLPFIFPLAFYLIFCTIEATFLSSTALKVPTGGWFSLMMSAIYSCIMLLWFWGAQYKTNYFNKNATNLSKLLQSKGPSDSAESKDVLKSQPQIMVLGQVPVVRIRGVALYYSDVLYGAPPALERHVTRFPVLHDVNVVLTNRFVPVPEVMEHERFLVKQMPITGFFHVIARYGYGERVRQDEMFADAVLQRISMLLYTSLQARISCSSELQKLLPATLPPSYRSDTSVHRDIVLNVEPVLESAFAVGPIMEDSETAIDHNLIHKKSAPTLAGLEPRYTALDVKGDNKRPLTRNSAPAGTAVSEAYPATRPHASAHGFTDTSFQPVFHQEGPQGMVDATSAAILSAWAAQVASGEVQLDEGQSLTKELAQEIAILSTAQEHGVTYVVGQAQARSKSRVNMIKKYLVHEPFLFLVHNFTSKADLAFGIPEDRLSIVGLPYPLD